MNFKNEEIVELFFEVTKLNRRYSETHYKNMNPFKGQYRCLLVLESAGTVNQKYLASLLHIRPTSVSEILLKLEQKGLIGRVPSEKDKRVSLVSLTEEGVKAARRTRKDRAKAHCEMVSDLTEEEKSHLYIALEKIKNHYIKIGEHEHE